MQLQKNTFATEKLSPEFPLMKMRNIFTTENNLVGIKAKVQLRIEPVSTGAAVVSWSVEAFHFPGQILSIEKLKEIKMVIYIAKKAHSLQYS